MDRPFHVVHAVLSLDVGGLERIVLDLIRAGRRGGDRVTVVCLEKEGQLAGAALEAGASVHSLGKPPGRRLEVLPAARSLMASLRPDVVHTHQIGPAWYLAQAVEGLAVPFLHTEHGDPFARASHLWKVPKLRLFYHQTARWLRLFCCVSRNISTAMGRFGTVPRSLLRVVPNGIRTDEPEGMPSPEQVRQRWSIPAHAAVIGTVGRLDEVKRQDLLLEAFSQVAEAWPDSYLLVVGDGPERERLQNHAMTLGVEKRVRFTGFQQQPEAYYRAMDVFALTSRSEGLPVSLLEAWAAGKPAVCTSVGGIPAVVSDGLDAHLVPSGHVKAVADALKHLLRHPQHAQVMGKRGRSKVCQHHSLEHMADAYREHYVKIRNDPGVR